MIKHKKYKVLGPMLPTKTGYSNFHYSVDNNGYYANHKNYMKLLHKQMKGIYPVEVIHCTYFINKDTLKDISYNDGSRRHEYVVFSVYYVHVYVNVNIFIYVYVHVYNCIDTHDIID